MLVAKKQLKCAYWIIFSNLWKLKCLCVTNEGRKRRMGFGKKGKNSFTIHRSEEVLPGEMRGGLSRGSSASSDGEGSADGDRFATKLSQLNGKFYDFLTNFLDELLICKNFFSLYFSLIIIFYWFSHISHQFWGGFCWVIFSQKFITIFIKSDSTSYQKQHFIFIFLTFISLSIYLFLVCEVLRDRNSQLH